MVRPGFYFFVDFIEVEEILNGYSHWINCWYYKKSPQGYKPWG